MAILSKKIFQSIGKPKLKWFDYEATLLLPPDSVVQLTLGSVEVDSDDGLLEEQQECLLHLLQFWTLTLDAGGVFVQTDFKKIKRGARAVSGWCVRKYWKSSQAQKSRWWLVGAGGMSVPGSLFDRSGGTTGFRSLLKNDRNHVVIAFQRSRPRVKKYKGRESSVG